MRVNIVPIYILWCLKHVTRAASPPAGDKQSPEKSQDVPADLGRNEPGIRNTTWEGFSIDEFNDIAASLDDLDDDGDILSFSGFVSDDDDLDLFRVEPEQPTIFNIVENPPAQAFTQMPGMPENILLRGVCRRAGGSDWHLTGVDLQHLGYLTGSRRLVGVFRDAVKASGPSTSADQIPACCDLIKTIGEKLADRELKLFILFLEMYIDSFKTSPPQDGVGDEIRCFCSFMMSRTDEKSVRSGVKYLSSILSLAERGKSGVRDSQEAQDEAREDGARLESAKQFFLGFDRYFRPADLFTHIVDLFGSATVKSLIFAKFHDACKGDEVLCSRFRALYEVFFDADLPETILEIVNNVSKVGKLKDGGATGRARGSYPQSAYNTFFTKQLKFVDLEIFGKVAGSLNLLLGLTPDNRARTTMPTLDASSRSTSSTGGMNLCWYSISLIYETRSRIEDICGVLLEINRPCASYSLMTSAYAIAKVNHCIYSILTLLTRPEIYHTAVRALEDAIKQFVFCKVCTGMAITFVDELREKFI